MSKKPSAALAAAMKADVPKPTEATLEKIRGLLRESRDNEKQIKSLEELLASKKADQLKLTQITLPDLFTDVGIDVLGLPAEGNLPAYDGRLTNYYHANIATDWEPEAKEKAFKYLADYRVDGENAGAEDMIKSLIIVQLGRGDRKMAKRVEAGLRKVGVAFTSELSIPWNTLTAWVKEQIEVHKTTPDLTVLGATVGKVVKLKERKDK